MRETSVDEVFVGELFYCQDRKAFFRRIEAQDNFADVVWAESAKDKEVFKFEPQYKVVV